MLFPEYRGLFYATALSDVAVSVAAATVKLVNVTTAPDLEILIEPSPAAPVPVCRTLPPEVDV
jgi:hypothetical protein